MKSCSNGQFLSNVGLQGSKLKTSSTEIDSVSEMLCFTNMTL